MMWKKALTREDRRIIRGAGQNTTHWITCVTEDVSAVVKQEEMNTTSMAAATHEVASALGVDGGEGGCECESCGLHDG
jgi:hypothetical protein